MIKYSAIPSPLFGYKQMFEAVNLVDNAFAAGYFKNHLEEIDCAWIALDNDRVVGWAAVCIGRNDMQSFGMLNMFYERDTRWNNQIWRIIEMC